MTDVLKNNEIAISWICKDKTEISSSITTTKDLSLYGEIHIDCSDKANGNVLTSRNVTATVLPL